MEREKVRQVAGFSRFYEEYARQVYRFLLALTREEALAEELTQETFYQAFLHIDSFEGRCGVYTWLCQIGKNAYFKEQRRRKRTVPAEWAGEAQVGFAPDPLETLAEKEQAKRLHTHLSHLPEPYREVFTLKVFGELGYEEIARLYGKSPSWARVTCYRAKEQLLARLEEEDGR